MRKFTLAAAALYAAVALCVTATFVVVATYPALAADTTVTIPWGDWMSDIVVALAPVITTALGGLAMVVLSFLPGPLRAIAAVWWQRQADEVLGWAVAYAVAQTKGAVSGKVLTVELTNEVLAAAANYAIEKAPALVKRIAGGDIEKLFDMLLARLEARGMVKEDFSTDEFTLPDWVTKLG